MDMSYDMIQDLYITQDLLAEMVRWFLICHCYKNVLFFLKSFLPLLKISHYVLYISETIN